MPTKTQLEAEMARILRALKHADRERYTMLVRDLAAAMVQLREHFLTGTGRPDWTGQTWQYRAAVREIYGEADYSAEDRAKMQTTVRYHIGNLLRERLSATELEDAGLTAPSPYDRRAARRQRDSALLASIGEEEEPDTDQAAKLVALREALAALARFRIPKRKPTPELVEYLETVDRVLVAIRDRSNALHGEAERALGTVA